MTKRSKIGDLANAFDMEAFKVSNREAPEEGVATSLQPIDDPKRIALMNVAVERTGPFNYEQISPEHRLFLLDRQTAIGRIIGTAVIEAGRELLLAKDLITEHYGRGSWTAWLQTALSFSEQTARNYMGAAKWHEKTPTVGALPPGALYLGANAPEDVQTEILRLIESGASVAAADIKELIKEHKAASIDASADSVIAVSNDEIASPSIVMSIAFAKHKEDDTVLTDGLGAADQEDAFVAADLHVRNDGEGTNLRMSTPAGSGYETADTLGDEEPRPIGIYIGGTDQAAMEFVSRLREVLDDETIRDLIALLAKTSAASMFEILDGKHATR